MGASLGSGRMTRIWLDAGASNRSVCTGVLVAGGLSAAESPLSRSPVAAIFAGGAGFAIAVVGTDVVGRAAAAGAGPASSVANCSTISELARSSAAAGSAFGQAIREFILSARRAGRWTFAATVGRRLVSVCAIFVVALCWTLMRLVCAYAGLWCSCGGCNPAR